MTSPLLPLFPSPGRVSQVQISQKAKKEFCAIRKSVLDLDRHTCRHCGFTDHGPYMQVHHVDHDHANNTMGNLVAACTHCHAVHHVGLWETAASVVWLPEITQAEVSHLSRAIMVASHAANVAMTATTPMRMLDGALSMDRGAQRILDDLERRSRIASDRLGISGPRDLANVLMALSDEYNERRAEMFASYRIVLPLALPSKLGSVAERAPGYVEGWLAPGGAFHGCRPDSWASMLASRGL